mgnify:CR=1 FL=1
MKRLEGKQIIVTGAAGGIGSLVSMRLTALGAYVTGVDRVECPKCPETILADLATEAGQTKLAESLKGRQVDILVNNAGLFAANPIDASDITWLDGWEETLRINLTAAAELSRYAVRHWLEGGQPGRIVHIASRAAYRGDSPDHWHYAAAKGGLKMLTRAMAVEWGPHNLQTNGLGPGYIRTAMTGALSVDPAFDRRIRARTPAGRWGEAGELVGTAVFLASGASDFVNGQIVYVDGGFSHAMSGTTPLV